MSFEEKLKERCYTESGPYRRPFAPNRHWSSAEVLIVGTNPATPIRDELGSFENYWQALTHTPEAFYNYYHQAHGGGASKSTTNANLLLSLLEPINTLTTNVVWYPVSRKNEIPKMEWELGAQALDELIQHIQPKVIFCHGADAERFGRKYVSGLDRYIPATEQAAQLVDEMLILAFHHFSGQGLRGGARFALKEELPIFATIIREHICA